MEMLETSKTSGSAHNKVGHCVMGVMASGVENVGLGMHCEMLTGVDGSLEYWPRGIIAIQSNVITKPKTFACKSICRRTCNFEQSFFGPVSSISSA